MFFFFGYISRSGNTAFSYNHIEQLVSLARRNVEQPQEEVNLAGVGCDDNSSADLLDTSIETWSSLRRTEKHQNSFWNRFRSGLESLMRLLGLHRRTHALVPSDLSDNKQDCECLFPWGRNKSGNENRDENGNENRYDGSEHNISADNHSDPDGPPNNPQDETENRPLLGSAQYHDCRGERRVQGLSSVARQRVTIDEESVGLRISEESGNRE